MALTRSYLKGLQLTEEQVNAIIEAHVETVDALKAQAADIQAKLDAAPSAESISEIQAKFDSLNGEYSAYRADTEARDTRRKKEAAYINALKDAGVSDKRFDAIIRCDSDAIDAIELDDNGAIVGADDLRQSITNNWSDFITQHKEIPGAPVPQPPSPAPVAYTMADIRGMSAEQINANWDAIQNTLKGN